MASSKLPPKALSLSRFLLRRQVLSLYKEAMKSVKLTENANQRNALKDWIRTEFKNNSKDADENSIKMSLTQGKKSLQQLQSSLRRAQ
uniref:LYR motif-containing protein 2 n=1 Tax=Strigamia maritima TaxID=126957 RepID=T1JCA7_STRMM